MLHLCDQRGACVAIAPKDWLQLLSRARQYGWIPTGTVRPPARFDFGPVESDSWDGNYEFPEGQVVTRRDAEHLRFALQDAIGDGRFHDYSAELIGFFLTFFRHSFVICPDSRDIRAFSSAPHAQEGASELAVMGHLAQS